MVVEKVFDPLAEVSILDTVGSFPPRLIGESLAKLWAVRGGKIVPATDAKGATYTCPITLAAIESPALLGDGILYEEAQIVKWLKVHDRSPYTNVVLDRRSLVRVAPLREVFEQFLVSNQEVGCSPAQRLLHEMHRIDASEEPLHCRVGQLQAAVSRATVDVEELSASLKIARVRLDSLRSEICACEEKAAILLQAWARGRQARERVSALRRAAERGVMRRHCIRVIQARARSFLAAVQVQQECSELARLSEQAAHVIQRFWRWHRKSQARMRKRRERRQKLKQGKRDAVIVPPPAPNLKEAAPAPEKRGGVMDCMVKGVIQQYISVQKKEKRAVLSFVLNQFKYSGECQILILVNNSQEATGLKTALSTSASFSFTALMIVKEQSDEYEQFTQLKNTVGIITLETLLSNFDISYANYLIALDMPEDLDPFLERIRGLRSVTYFATSPAEMKVLQALEASFTIKMRQMSCLGELARTERQNALKMKLQSLGTRRRTKI